MPLDQDGAKDQAKNPVSYSKENGYLREKSIHDFYQFVHENAFQAAQWAKRE